jgi:hypothetical protein
VAGVHYDAYELLENNLGDIAVPWKDFPMEPADPVQAATCWLAIATDQYWLSSSQPAMPFQPLTAERTDHSRI